MPATFGLIAINLAIYFAMLATADASHRVAFTAAHVTEWGAIVTSRVLAGDWLRLVAAMFLHGSIAHVAFNMIALYQIGSYLEPWYGTRRYLALYLICGVVSSIVSAWWYRGSPIPQVGASGAIMALIGAGVVSAWRIGPRGRTFRNALIVWGLVTVVNGFAATANNAAHIGGFAAGALGVLVFGRRGRAAAEQLARDPVPPDDMPDAITCPRCQAGNTRGSRFCGSCGAALATPITPSG